MHCLCSPCQGSFLPLSKVSSNLCMNWIVWPEALNLRLTKRWSVMPAPVVLATVSLHTWGTEKAIPPHSEPEPGRWVSLLQHQVKRELSNSLPFSWQFPFFINFWYFLFSALYIFSVYILLRDLKNFKAGPKNSINSQEIRMTLFFFLRHITDENFFDVFKSISI